MLESRAARYRQLLPLCEKIVRFGIGIGELLAFHTAVMKKGDLEKVSYSTAAFVLMNGIDTSDKLFDAKKLLNDTWIQIHMVNLFSACQNKALNALIKLQCFGITEEEILNIQEFLNRARLESTRGIGTHNHFDSSLFNSSNESATNIGPNFGAPKSRR